MFTSQTLVATAGLGNLAQFEGATFLYRSGTKTQIVGEEGISNYEYGHFLTNSSSNILGAGFSPATDYKTTSFINNGVNCTSINIAEGTYVSGFPTVTTTYFNGETRVSSVELGDTSRTSTVLSTYGSFDVGTSNVVTSSARTITAITQIFPTGKTDPRQMPIYALFTTSRTLTIRTFGSLSTTNTTSYIFPASLVSKSTSNSIYGLTATQPLATATATTTISHTFSTSSLRWYGRGFNQIPIASYQPPFNSLNQSQQYGWVYQFAVSKYPSSPIDVTPYYTFSSDNTSAYASIYTTLGFFPSPISKVTINRPSSTVLSYPDNYTTLNSLTQLAVGTDRTLPVATFISNGGIYRGSSIDINNHTSVFQNGAFPDLVQTGLMGRCWEIVSSSFTSSYTSSRAAGLGSVLVFTKTGVAGYSENLLNSSIANELLLNRFNIFNGQNEYYVPSFSKIKVNQATSLANFSANTAVYSSSVLQSIAGSVVEFPNIKTTSLTTVWVSQTYFVNSTLISTTTFRGSVTDTITQAQTRYISDSSPSLITGLITNSYKSYTGTRNITEIATIVPSTTSYSLTVSISTIQEEQLTASLTGRSARTQYPVDNANLNVGYQTYVQSTFVNGNQFNDTMGSSSRYAVNIGTKTSSAFNGRVLTVIYKSISGGIVSSVSPYEYLYPTSTAQWVYAGA